MIEACAVQGVHVVRDLLLQFDDLEDDDKSEDLAIEPSLLHQCKQDLQVALVDVLWQLRVGERTVHSCE